MVWVERKDSCVNGVGREKELLCGWCG
jgi:hypothetical protein